MVFTILSCLFVKEIQVKSLTNCEIPSSNPLQRACSGFLIAVCASKSCFRNPSVILKIVPKARYECSLENWPMRAKKAGREIWCGFRNNFRTRKCFLRSKQKLQIKFSLELGRLKFKNHLRMYRKYWFNCIDLQQKYLTGAIISLKGQ